MALVLWLIWKTGIGSSFLFNSSMGGWSKQDNLLTPASGVQLKQFWLETRSAYVRLARLGKLAVNR